MKIPQQTMFVSIQRVIQWLCNLPFTIAVLCIKHCLISKVHIANCCELLREWKCGGLETSDLPVFSCFMSRCLLRFWKSCVVERYWEKKQYSIKLNWQIGNAPLKWLYMNVHLCTFHILVILKCSKTYYPFSEGLYFVTSSL